MFTSVKEIPTMSLESVNNKKPISGPSSSLRIPDNSSSSRVESSQPNRLQASTAPLVVERNMKELTLLKSLLTASLKVMQNPNNDIKDGDKSNIERLKAQIDSLKKTADEYQTSVDQLSKKNEIQKMRCVLQGMKVNKDLKQEVGFFLANFGTRHMSQVLEHIDQPSDLARLKEYQLSALRTAWNHFRFENNDSQFKRNPDFGSEIDTAIALKNINEDFLNHISEGTVLEEYGHWNMQLVGKALNGLSQAFSLVNIHLEKNLNPDERLAQVKTHLGGLLIAQIGEDNRVETLPDQKSALANSLGKLATLVQVKLNELKGNPDAEFAFKALLAGCKENPYIDVKQDVESGQFRITLSDKAEQDVTQIKQKRIALQREMHRELEMIFEQRPDYKNRFENYSLLNALKGEMSGYADTGDWDAFRQIAEKVGLKSEQAAQSFSQFLVLMGHSAYEASPEAIKYYIDIADQTRQQVAEEFGPVLGEAVKSVTKQVVGKSVELGVALVTLDPAKVIGADNLQSIQRLAASTGENARALSFALVQYAHATKQSINAASPEFVQNITHSLANKVVDVGSQVLESDAVQIPLLAAEDLVDSVRTLASGALTVRNVAVGLNDLTGGRVPQWMGSLAGNLAGMTSQLFAERTVEGMQALYDEIRDSGVKETAREFGAFMLDNLESVVADPERFDKTQHEANQTWGDLFDIRVRPSSTSVRIKQELLDRNPQSLIDNMNRKLDQFRSDGNNAGIVALYRACDSLDFVDIDGTWFGSGHIKHTLNMDKKEVPSVDQLATHDSPLEALKASNKAMAREHSLVSTKFVASQLLTGLEQKKQKNYQSDLKNPFVSSTHAMMTGIKAEKIGLCQLAVANAESLKEIVQIIDSSAKDIESMARTLGQKVGATVEQLNIIKQRVIDMNQ